jgi:hypothetical protein
MSAGGDRCPQEIGNFWSASAESCEIVSKNYKGPVDNPIESRGILVENGG